MNPRDVTLMYIYGIGSLIAAIYVLTSDTGTFARRLFRAVVIVMMFVCFSMLIDIDNKLAHPQQVIVVTPEATSAK